MSSNDTTILFWRNITGSAAMSRWEETRREASIAPRPAPIRPNSPRCQYESGVTVRQVRHNGEIKWRGELLYLSEILAKEPVGLKPIDEQRWELRYSFH